MRGAVVFVGLSSGGLAVIDPSSGVPSLKKDQPRGEGFFCFKQEVRFFLQDSREASFLFLFSFL
jgi:hypothetical protein